MYVSREFSYESPGERIWKSVHICQSYYQTSRGILFWGHSVYGVGEKCWEFHGGSTGQTSLSLKNLMWKENSWPKWSSWSYSTLVTHVARGSAGQLVLTVLEGSMEGTRYQRKPRRQWINDIENWPLTWLTNHCPSVLWHCWLGYLTCKIVSEMTYNVSSGMLNPTIPYHPPAWMPNLQHSCQSLFNWRYERWR